MRRPTRRTIALGLVWASLGFDLLVIGADLAIGQFHHAALMALAVVGLTTWVWFSPKLEQQLDAHTATAIAQQRMAEAQQRMSELALDQIQAQRRAGTLRVDVMAERGKARMN